VKQSAWIFFQQNIGTSLRAECFRPPDDLLHMGCALIAAMGIAGKQMGKAHAQNGIRRCLKNFRK